MYAIYVKYSCAPGRPAAIIEKMKENGILQALLPQDGSITSVYYFAEKDPNELLLVEQWETREHQQVHIGQPHMAQMRTFKDEYILNTALGEMELK